jgi:hypothetical protein
MNTQSNTPKDSANAQSLTSLSSSTISPSTRMGVLALPLLLLVPPTVALGSATPLDCKLTDVESHRGSQLDRAVEAESRSVTVVFDEERPTLILSREGKPEALDDVTITPTSIADALSLGIDPASDSIVFQTYARMRCARSSQPAYRAAIRPRETELIDQLA